jgi:hypothetical protein
VQDVKVQLAKQAGGMDPERLGLFDPANKKILKDRKALVNQQKDVMAGKEILVKDLGRASNLVVEPKLICICRTTNNMDDGLHHRISGSDTHPPHHSSPSTTIHLLLRASPHHVAIPFNGHDCLALSQARV